MKYINSIMKGRRKKQRLFPCRETGQVVLILVLIMTVALAIGISVVQRSLSDISTSGKVEQSSRAFSAAEAGIEKALKGDFGSVTFSENNSEAQISPEELFPPQTGAGNIQPPFEYPPLAKEETAHVWLADPSADLPSCNPPKACYKHSSLDVYWGDPKATEDKAALAVNIVYYGTDLNDPDPSQRTVAKYRTRKWYLDQQIRNNGFCQITCSGNNPIGPNNYQCKFTLGNNSGCLNSPGGFDNSPLPGNLMLIRARLLDNTTSQPFAVGATSQCANCSLPTQAKRFASTGISGQTQRKIELFQVLNVVPSYFDYAIFAVGEINKQ